LVRVNDLGLGGTQINAVDFAATARQHGVESFLVGYRETLPAAGPTLLDVADERGIPVRVLDEGGAGWRERRRRAAEMIRLADQLEVDLVHVYGTGSARQAYWGPCKFGRRPLVQTVYEMSFYDVIYRRPCLIVGTKYQLEDLESTRGRVYLISPPVDLMRDAPGASRDMPAPVELANGASRVRLVIVSRLDHAMKAYGVGVAIRAMAQLGRDDVDLIVVGGGTAETELRELGDSVNRRLDRPAVRFTGPMADPRTAYDRADIVLGMGGSAARGLAFGKALIVIGERGWCATFTPESSASVYRSSFWSPDEVEQPEQRLLSELAPLLENSGTRTALGEYGRAFAESHFGLEQMTERLVAVYRDALVSYDRADWIRDLTTEAIRAAGKIRHRVAPGR
jgi:glycosyltransferase involved in cell wall biosynthesis